MEDLKQAINWDVLRNPIYSIINGQETLIEGYNALVRNDNNETLSVMKSSYTPTYNDEFLERVEKISDISKMSLSGFTEFKGGRKVLAFLKNTTDIVKIGNHTLEDYMIIGNSFDGSSGFFVGTSTTLIRCTNQFSQISKMLNIRHTKNANVKAEEIYAYLDFYFNQRKELFETFERWGDKTVNPQITEKLIKRVLDIKEDKISTRKERQRILLRANIKSEMDDLGENLWGLFNGVTKYTTHSITSKNKTFGNVFGTAANLNKKAFEFSSEIFETV